MKKAAATVALILLIFLCFFITGCNTSKRPQMIFSSQPITSKSIEQKEMVFKPEQRIYYAIIVPKKFKNNVIRVQLISKNEKSEFGGYSLLRTEDYHIQNPYYFVDYLTVPSKGHYIMSIFEHQNFRQPICRGDFWIR